MKTKTYFCSDTHFNHPNILRYEPQRLDAIAKYVVENNLVYDLLQELDTLRDKYNKEKEGWDHVPNWGWNYCEYYLQEEVAFNLKNNKGEINALKKIFNNILTKDYIFKDDNLEKEKGYSNEKLRQILIKDQIKVILKYQTEMLIDKWNKVVKDDDLVYFLGDFGFGNDKELEEIGRRLKGHKTIIIGNHDGRKYNSDKTIIYNSTLIKHFKACGFERVEFNPIILKGCFILSHEPLYYMNESIPYFNIYGHVHNNPMFKTKTENSLCACLDRWGYKPIEIKEYNEYIPE